MPSTELPILINKRQPDLNNYLQRIERDSPFYPMATSKRSKSDHQEKIMDDSASIMSSSTATSTTQMLKAKFTRRSQSTKDAKIQLSPREKQLEREAYRTSPMILAVQGAMRR
jgi:hypothetical protein